MSGGDVFDRASNIFVGSDVGRGVFGVSDCTLYQG